MPFPAEIRPTPNANASRFEEGASQFRHQENRDDFVQQREMNLRLPFMNRDSSMNSTLQGVQTDFSMQFEKRESIEQVTWQPCRWR
jgi:hypothetical protein